MMKDSVCRSDCVEMNNMKKVMAILITLTICLTVTGCKSQSMTLGEVMSVQRGEIPLESVL